MALFDIFKKREKQIDTANSTASKQGMYSFLATGPEEEIISLLNNCDTSSENPSPRQWQKLSGILYNNLSIYERAINIHATLLGQINISPDSGISDRTKTLITDFLSDTPILAEYQPYLSDVRGINNLSRQMVIDVLKDGMSFAQDRFREDKNGITNEYLGVLGFDPKNFHFGSIADDMFLHLIYINDQYPRLDADNNLFDNPFFHVLKLESDHSDPWGVPLIRGGKILADVLVSMLVAVKLQTMRFANPASFNLIQVKDSQLMKDATFRENFSKVVKDLRGNVEQALRQMNKGKQQELIHSIPAEISLDSKVFGEGFSNFIDHETLWEDSDTLFECAWRSSFPPRNQNRWRGNWLR